MSPNGLEASGAERRLRLMQNKLLAKDWREDTRLNAFQHEIKRMADGENIRFKMENYTFVPTLSPNHH